MTAPFQIMIPSFSVDPTRARLRFTVMPKENQPQVTKIIDYWSVSDGRGHTLRAEPDVPNRYIPASLPQKTITLTLEDLPSELCPDSLEILVHFILQSGTCVDACYCYRAAAKSLTPTRTVVSEATEEEEDRLFDVLTNASQYEKKLEAEKKEALQKAAATPRDDVHKWGKIPELAPFMKAIYQEMRYTKDQGGDPHTVTNGQFVMHSQGGYVYTFETDSDFFLPEDTPVTLKIGVVPYSGTVMLCENDQVMIALNTIPYSDSNMRIPKAILYPETWELLKMLNERLEKIEDEPSIARTILRDGPLLAKAGPLHQMPRGQETAFDHAMNSKVTVIWGPPGTGKTYIMAKISAEFLRQGKSVLIVSHSNVSVDNVAKQIYAQTKDGPLSGLLEEGKILRYGYVRDEELRKNQVITSFNVANRRNPDRERFEQLLKDFRDLKEKAKTITDATLQGEIIRINNEMKSIRKKVKEVEQELVVNAQLVVTTATKTYVNPLFDSLTYDVVMFDEISMAYIPQIIAAASFATRHMICVGDFRQLSPIVQEPLAKEQLGIDLFEYLNISADYRDIKLHPWLVMLDEQRRMHPDISAFPSRYVYRGLLKDHEGMDAKRQNIANTAPFHHPLCLIDLFGTCCFGSKNEDNSRYNILSAVFSFATALRCEESQAALDGFSPEDKVGIITPYVAQAKLIKAMIKDHRKSRHPTDVSCATVHQFQGSERNAIIFDAVESCPSTKAGWLMSKNEGGAVSRLINVAITRARGRFIAVANKTFWQSKVSSDNLFGSLVKYMSTESHVLDHRNGALAQYVAESPLGSCIKVYTSTAACNCDLLEDIRGAKSKIVLMIPPGSMNPTYAPVVLEELRKRADGKVTVAIVHDSTVKLPPAYEELAIPSVKVTMPLLFVDGMVWYGLPIYRHAYSERQVHYPIHSDIMVRFTGKHTVSMIKSLVEYGSIQSPLTTGFALYAKNHLTCSECGKALMLVKNERHYLRCSACKKSFSITPHTVNRYLDQSGGRCPLCGRDQFAVRGNNTVYVKCAENHLYKLDEI